MSVIPVKTTKVNLDDGIDKDEWNRIKSEDKVGKKDEVKFKLADGTTVTKTFKEMEQVFKKNPNALVSLKADADDPGSDLKARAALLPKEIENLLKQVKEAEMLKNETQVAKLQEQIAKSLSQAQFLQSKGVSFSEAQLKAMNSAANMLGGDGSGAKAQVMSTKSTGGGSAPSGSSGSSGTSSGMKAQGVGGGGQGTSSAYPPAGWKAQGVGSSGSGFNTSAYMQSMNVTDQIMSSWDEINKNSSRGKQLMMLFFYFARMAESGDMGAMYQFMKFITYVVSKDKAKQQIEMGKKLIALQDLSRQWTNKLMNLSTDSSDPNASMELSKTMTIVKSETDAIATSQKLISQMMEEFAQVTETLTNVTKSALETAGRIQRRVSTFS